MISISKMLRTTNRISRPKDYSRINSQYNTYEGDLESPNFIQQNTTDVSLADMKEYSGTWNANINNGATGTITMTSESDAKIKEFIIQNNGAQTISYVEIRLNDSLIHTTQAIGAGQSEIIDSLTDTIEPINGEYEITLYNNTGNGWVYNISARRRVLVL